MQSLKPISRFIQKNPILSPLSNFFPIHLATLVFYGGIGFYSALSLAWLMEEANITNFFRHLEQLQNHGEITIRVVKTSSLPAKRVSDLLDLSHSRL